jgi:Protein of unknown function (DUF3011)/Ricin-type beta-trefoil lectin domain-like
MRNRALFSMLSLMALIPAALAQGGFDGPGWYQITNLKSGKALALDRDLSSVVQFPPSAMEFQAWLFQPANPGYFFIRNGVNGNTLEPTAGANSSPVLAAPFRGTISQMWRLQPGKDGNALIVNYYGKTLDLPNGSPRDGVRMQIYDLNGDSNQRYMLRRVNGDYGARWRGEGRREERREEGRGGGYAVTCASEDGRRKFCQVDTRAGVRLVRELGGSACRLNETWGFDQRGIWVDRGCRAEFQVGAH